LWGYKHNSGNKQWPAGGLIAVGAAAGEQQHGWQRVLLISSPTIPFN
jgi:hypothetical protein